MSSAVSNTPSGPGAAHLAGRRALGSGARRRRCRTSSPESPVLMYGPFQPMPTLRNVAVVKSGVPGAGLSSSSNDRRPAAHVAEEPEAARDVGPAEDGLVQQPRLLRASRPPSRRRAAAGPSGVMAAARMASTARMTRDLDQREAGGARMSRVIGSSGPGQVEHRQVERHGDQHEHAGEHQERDRPEQRDGAVHRPVHLAVVVLPDLLQRLRHLPRLLAERHHLDDERRELADGAEGARERVAGQHARHGGAEAPGDVRVADDALDDGERRRHLDARLVQAAEEVREARERELPRRRRRRRAAAAATGRATPARPAPARAAGTARRATTRAARITRPFAGDERADRLHDARRQRQLEVRVDALVDPREPRDREADQHGEQHGQQAHDEQRVGRRPRARASAMASCHSSCCTRSSSALSTRPVASPARTMLT